MGPDGQGVQYFVNPDKNGAQICKEVQTKLLREIFEKALPQKRVMANRNEGVILVDRAPLAIVQVLSEEHSRIAWKPSRVIALAIDQAAVEQ